MRMTQEQLLAYNVKRSKDVNKDGKFVYIKRQDVNELADDGSENTLLSRISKHLDDNGIWFFHDRSAKKNRRGVPDIIAALPNGRTIYVELKSKTGSLRDDQKIVKLQLLGLGHEFYECRSFKRFLEIVSM